MLILYSNTKCNATFNDQFIAPKKINSYWNKVKLVITRNVSKWTTKQRRIMGLKHHKTFNLDWDEN